ncbi:unnamed protein product [Dracunculus medinensis]|uniref:Reverse transcriptase domain-containing protein n=1 Tax=Dracunculus medinensis TaxID=318479 RepID=A0A0N4UMM2_DRAME|nr:unnamed protein product [Dracunculus medinensis]
MDIACRHSRGIQVNPKHRTTDLENADDVVLFADSYDEMQIMLNKCQQLQRESDSGYMGSSSDKIPHDRIHLYSNTTCVNNVITERHLRWLRHENNNLQLSLVNSMANLTITSFPCNAICKRKNKYIIEQEKGVLGRGIKILKESLTEMCQVLNVINLEFTAMIQKFEEQYEDMQVREVSILVSINQYRFLSILTQLIILTKQTKLKRLIL